MTPQEVAMQQQMTTLQASLNTLIQIVGKMGKESTIVGDSFQHTSNRLQIITSDIKQLDSTLKSITKSIAKKSREISNEQELASYTDYINNQKRIFGQSTLIEQRRLRQSAIELKQYQLHTKSLRDEFKERSQIAREEIKQLKAKLDAGGLSPTEQDAVAKQIREKTKERKLATQNQWQARQSQRAATQQMGGVENRLDDIYVKARLSKFATSAEDRVRQTLTGFYTMLVGLTAKGIKDSYLTARAEIKTQGSLGGFFDNGPSQSSTASLGMSRPEFVQFAADNRRVMLAMGGMTETVKQLSDAQEQLYGVTGDLKQSTIIAMQQFDILTNSGIRLTAAGMSDFTKSLVADYKNYGAKTGQTLEQFSATIKDINDDEATQNALMQSASMQERLNIIKNNQLRLQENVALGMTVQQATAAAKALNRLAGEGPLERYKKSVRLQAALGIMGIGGGAEAAQIYRTPANLRTAAQNQFLSNTLSEFSNRTATQMGGSDLGSAILAEHIRQIPGISEGDLKSLNTNTVSPVADPINRNTTALEQLNQSMKQWLGFFKAIDTIKTAIVNAPWAAIGVGIGTGILGIFGAKGVLKLMSKLGLGLGKLSLGMFGKLGGAAGSVFTKLGGMFKSGATTGGFAGGVLGKSGDAVGTVASGFERLGSAKALMGVAALAGVAATIWISGKAFKQFADVHWQDVTLGLAAIGGLGIVGSIAGGAAAPIAVGAAAIAAMGSAMWITGKAAQAFAQAFQTVAAIQWGKFGAELADFGVGLGKLWDASPNPLKVGVLSAAIGTLGIALTPLAANSALFDGAKFSLFVDKLIALSNIDADKLQRVANATRVVTQSAEPTISGTVATIMGDAWNMITGKPRDAATQPLTQQDGRVVSVPINGAIDPKTGKPVTETANLQLAKMTEANKYLKVVADNIPTLVDLATKQLAAASNSPTSPQQKAPQQQTKGFLSWAYQYL